MTTETILNSNTLFSKETFVKSKAVWKELAKQKKTTFEHHVFYFILFSHEPEIKFKKSFSPLVNPNKIASVNGDVYYNLKAQLGELTQQGSIPLKFIEPWLGLLLSEDEYTIKGGWYKNVKSESDIFDVINERAKKVLSSIDKKDVV